MPHTQTTRLFADLPKVNQTDQLLEIVQILCILQGVLPSMFEDHPLQLSSLLEGVRTVCLQTSKKEDGDEEEKATSCIHQQTVLQLYALRLLLGSDMKQWDWMRQVRPQHTLHSPHILT